MPVELRHQVGLHVVHESSFFGLVDGKRLQRLPVVIEFRQDDRVVAGHQRTRRVAVVLQRRRGAVTGARLQAQAYLGPFGSSPSCPASASSVFC